MKNNISWQVKNYMKFNFGVHKWSFIRMQTHIFVYASSMAAFMLQQSWVEEHLACKTENIFYLALYGKFADSWIRI